MLRAGPAKKVTIYVGEDRQYHGRSVYGAILDYLFFRGVSGANVVRGIAGFGADHHLHTTRILNVAENLPIRIEFIESAEKVEELLAKLQEMAGTGLIEIQDTTIAKAYETSKEHGPENRAGLEAGRQCPANAHIRRRKRQMARSAALSSVGGKHARQRYCRSHGAPGNFGLWCKP